MQRSLDVYFELGIQLGKVQNFVSITIFLDDVGVHTNENKINIKNGDEAYVEQKNRRVVGGSDADRNEL
jgi:hypothetical protein